MAEPEPLHLDPSTLHESIDDTSIVDNSHDSNSNDSHSSTSAIISNLMTEISEDLPEFELEDEAVEEDCEFELEETVGETSASDDLASDDIASVDGTHQAREPEENANLLSGEFDAKTLENLLTETDVIEENEVIEVIEETEKSEDEQPEFQYIEETDVSDSCSPSELSHVDELTRTTPEKGSSNQTLEPDTLTGLQPPPEPESQSQDQDQDQDQEKVITTESDITAKNSDYSDDILSSSATASFDHSNVTEKTTVKFNEAPAFMGEKTVVKNNALAALNASYPDSDDSKHKTALDEKTALDQKTALEQKTVLDDKTDLQEKIDLDEIIEHEHSVGTLHQQQVQNLEMSLLERVDDLIGVLEKKHKSGNRPEQLPHKQFATGIHYIKFEKNHYLGGKWLRKAAMQGHAKAQLYLGMLFVQGNGVPKSMFHAYAWFSLAACQDIAEAIDARKKLEPRLTAKEINSSLRYAADILDKIHNF